MPRYQSNFVQFDFAEVNVYSTLPAGTILNSKQQEIAFIMVRSVLSGSFRCLDSSTRLNTKSFETTGDMVGILIVVDAWKINSLRPIEGQIEVVLSIAPVNSSKHSIISRGQLHLQI